MEWREEIEKRFFKNLNLTDEDHDIVTLSKIVTGPRRRYLRQVELNVYGEDSFSVVDGTQCTGSGYKSVAKFPETLSTWTPDVLLTVKLNIGPQGFRRSIWKTGLPDLPVVPVIGALHVNMDPNSSSGFAVDYCQFASQPLVLLKRD
ncbi:hypothetical protein INS49_003577 [Diaporthe citri]|uniref:uncharacterized protein n=1 Tax=Diaporthe citri TaxID=83186 RepID=UPI001C807711|nr:uncharacterized protein INS49_003577 [Diaporthe citri]KAG6355615.1 hypothetical protein INS49_003577 [Diaporthe citri]